VGKAQPARGLTGLVNGPGAALAGDSTLWYADLPKRYAEAVMSGGEGLNLGPRSGEGPGTTRRLFFVDWPLLDRHREEYVPSVDVWVDMQDASAAKFLDGATLRGTLADLAHRPLRTRPTFNTTTWGGHWGQEFLGHSTDAPGAIALMVAITRAPDFTAHWVTKSQHP
jgi:hypothetical protein